MQTDNAEYIRRTIRSVPDWPQPGVVFRDITPVLQDPRAFRVLIDLFVYRYMRQRLDLVAGVDARGFIVGSVLAYELNLGFVPIRKKGQVALPHRSRGILAGIRQCRRRDAHGFRAHRPTRVAGR